MKKLKNYTFKVWIDTSDISIPLSVCKNGFKILCFDFYIGKKLSVKIDKWISKAQNV